MDFYKRIRIILIFIFASSNLFPQIKPGEGAIFKLQETPIVSQDKLGLSFSYGVNFGDPTPMMWEYEIPDEGKPVLLDQFSFAASLGKTLEFNFRYMKSYSKGYNYDYLGVGRTRESPFYGIKWNAVKSENLNPDFSIEFNSKYQASTSLGSERSKFKYNFNADWGIYYLIFPYRFSFGAGYEVIEKINISAEYCYKTSWMGEFGNQSAYAGVSFSNIPFVSLDMGLYYFGYKFTDAILNREGFTWQNPNNIITVKEKNSYVLFSWSVRVNAGIF